MPFLAILGREFVVFQISTLEFAKVLRKNKKTLIQNQNCFIWVFWEFEKNSNL